MCAEDVSRMGLCVDHFRIWVRSEWADMLSKGLNKPKPVCWPSESSWEEYQVLSRFAKRKVRSQCADCLPAYKQQMLAAGRCTMPETVFIERNGDIVGINRTQASYWPLAVSGKLGKIVGMPDAEGLRIGFSLVKDDKSVCHVPQGDMFESETS